MILPIQLTTCRPKESAPNGRKLLPTFKSASNWTRGHLPEISTAVGAIFALSAIFALTRIQSASATPLNDPETEGLLFSDSETPCILSPWAMRLLIDLPGMSTNQILTARDNQTLSEAAQLSSEAAGNVAQQALSFGADLMKFSGSLAFKSTSWVFFKSVQEVSNAFDLVNFQTLRILAGVGILMHHIRVAYPIQS